MTVMSSGRLFGRVVVALGLVAAGLAVGAASPVAQAAPAQPTPLRIEIDLSNGGGLTVELPLISSGPTQVTVDWEDDATNAQPSCVTAPYPAGADALLEPLNISCTYLGPDAAADPVKVIEVLVTGSNPVTWFGGNEVTLGAANYEKVLSWGNVGILSLFGAFRGMSNLVDVPNTLPANVTDLAYSFAGATSFNDADIAGWNTSAVTDMTSMFLGATSFNRNIAGWNTSNVVSMANMFNGATSFNQNIGAWDTSSVVNMAGMFYRATSFNQNIGTWNTSSVNFMNDMFYRANSFNQNIGSWNVSNVVDMSRMFNETAVFNGDISGWNPVKVIDMRGMFQLALSFNRNISSWTVTDLETTTNMFRSATGFNNGCAINGNPCPDDFAWPNAPSLAEIGGMFAGTTSFNAEVVIDTDQVTSFAELFEGATSFNNGCAAGVFTCPLTLNADQVTTFRSAFVDALAFNQRLVFSSTANVTTIQGMFAGAIGFNNGCALGVFTCPLTFMANGTRSNFGALLNMGGAFSGAGAFNQSLDSWDVSTVTNMGALFYNQGIFNNGCAAGDATCPLTWSTPSLTRMDQMFNGVPDFDQAMPNFDTSNVTSMQSVFEHASGFDHDISGWNVRNVTNMNRMFFGANAFDQDLSSWCFDGQVSHVQFEVGSGFQNLTAKHPSWAGCTTPVVFAPAPGVTPPSTTTTPPTIAPPPIAPPTTSIPPLPPTLPETGRDARMALVALWLLVVGALVMRWRLPSRG
jgi:surface protein